MCPWDSEGLIFSIDVRSAVLDCGKVLSALRIFVNPQLGHATSWCFLAPHFGQLSCAIALPSSVPNVKSKAARAPDKLTD
jgi:hypothetical protein